MPVQFVSCPNLTEIAADAIIYVSEEDTALSILRVSNLPSLCFKNIRCNRALQQSNTTIEFGDSKYLDRRLRRRRISHDPLTPPVSFQVESGDEVLAKSGDAPAWIIRKSGGSVLNILLVPPPTLEPNERVFDYLNGSRFFQLLPLFHFLRRLTQEIDWARPPLRACLMFDDPNLHWPSYGFLDYNELLQHSISHSYHVAIATIPRDAWGCHAETVQLFKRSPQQLSLVIHGNDHTKAELAQKLSVEAYVQLLAQALRRVKRLERMTGLNVARVMAPPHGANSNEAVTAMSLLGFSGMCISTGSLRRWNSNADLPLTFGLEIGETLSCGFPTIPRFRLSSSCEGEIVISAFMDRPIIAVGHHQTVAGGLELLADVSANIDSLENVCWQSPEMMFRSNYLARRNNDTLHISPYSRRIRITVPDGITRLLVEPPIKDPAFRNWAVVPEQNLGNESTGLGFNAANCITVMPGQIIECAAVNCGRIAADSIASPSSLSFWPAARKLMSETRDRLDPLIYKLHKVRPCVLRG